MVALQALFVASEMFTAPPTFPHPIDALHHQRHPSIDNLACAGKVSSSTT